MDTEFRVPHIEVNTEHSIIYNSFTCPQVPRMYNNTYDWSTPSPINKCSAFDWDFVVGETLDNLYKDAEETIDTFEKVFLKPYFVEGTRILIKRELFNNTKKLYLLTKHKNTWFRSHVIILLEDFDHKYYDVKWRC